MVKCDSCGEREAKYKSLGGMEFCHECAHDLGLGHKHPGIDNTVHFLDGFASNAEIQKHLKEAEG